MAEETENTQETPEETPVEPEAVVQETPAEEPEAGSDPETGSDSETGSDPVEDVPAADEPAAEEAPAEEPAAEAPPAEPEAEAAPAQQSEPKKKRKRLPRSERPKKGRRVRTPSTERKPIVRLPKPEHVRGRRQERRGVVVSSAMDKTIVVKVDVIKSHPKYKKVVRRSVKFHAHDEQNSANVGDVVRIVETRPLSKTKHWRLAEVLEAAK